MGEEWYGHKAYSYTPKWDKEIERNPDKLPSSSALKVATRNGLLVMLIEVRGLGVMTVTMQSGDPKDKTGRVCYRDVAVWTNEQIEFD